VKDQAENKLHMRGAILAFLMADLSSEPRGGMSDEA